MRTILNIFGHMSKYLLATLVRLPQTQPHKPKQSKESTPSLSQRATKKNKNSRLSNISEESPSQFQTAGDKHGTIQNLFSFSLSPPQIKKLAGSPWDQPCDIFVVQSVGGLVVCWVLLSYQWLKSVVYLLLTFTLLTLSLKYVGQTDGHCIHLWMCSDRRHVCQQHLHIKSSTDKRIILLFLLASIFTVYVFFSFFCIFINIFYTFLILTSIIHSILINIQQS